ncbi:MAG: response regulator transcription factor [Saprospiraceae bacterium]|nr:response regulator transcription factor [Saprospiraceae bacterium]
MSKPKIKAAIIEDELKSQAMLQNLLRDYCPEVEVVGTAQTVQSGLKLLQTIQPDLLFLDIAMPDGDGFEVLERNPSNNFEVIFTTAYEEYAIRAFDFSAMNYLLKPISSEDLRKVLDQFLKIHAKTDRESQMGILKQSLSDRFERIALPTLEGLEFLKIENIIRCEADGSYTKFFLRNQQQILVSKSLNHYEKLLTQALFYRIHHKHLINLQYVTKYVKGTGGYVVLENGDHVDVSVRRKEGFLIAVKELM